MLGFFPRLYPDELLYSCIARYHMYSMNPSLKGTMVELFDNQHSLAVPDLPVNIDRFRESISHFFELSTDDLIFKHTFFRYYTAFVLPEIRDRSLSSMRFDKRQGATHMETGVMASTYKDKRFFEYCAICAEDDLRTYGEIYWHLPHQLPGVLVCTKHKIPLSRSIAPFRPTNRHHYVAASRENCPALAPIIYYDSKTMEHLLEIAKEAEKLLQQDFTCDRSTLRQTYLVLLQKKGLAQGKNHVFQRKLAERFRDFYGGECLQLLQSAVPMESENSWLKAITRKHRKAFHPIRHLLLIRFLGETVESIMSQLHTAYHPFGEGPFPCLNQAASHYKEFVVSDLKITRCTDTGKPVGTFTCACGFKYSRRGPDQTEADRFRIGRVKTFGPVWQSRLDEIIHVEKLSFRAAARKLGVDTNTVIKYSKKELPSTPSESLEPNGSGTLMETKQTKWNALRARYPDAGSKQLRKEEPALYAWLYRNCKNWLAENTPKPMGSDQSTARIDWGARDLRLAKRIQKAVQQLRQETPPVRITPHGISRRIRQQALIEQHLDKLPETKKTLAQLSETRDAFHIRRIHWAVQDVREAGLEPVEWLVVRVAAIRPPLSPVVAKEIQRILLDASTAERNAL